MKSFNQDFLNWGLLTEYRSGITAIAAIGVIATHGADFIGSLGDNYNIILRIMNLGNIGVDIFLTLSAIGLYFSYIKGKNDRKIFYRKRVLRIFFVYMLIAIPFFGWKYFFVTFSISDFILDLTTLGFWFYHRGAWYVALLLPLYLFYPFFHDFITYEDKKKLNIWKLVLVCIIVLILAVWFFISNIDILNNIYFVLRRMYSFFIGILVAPLVINKDKLTSFQFFCIGSLFIIEELFEMSTGIYMQFGFSLFVCIILSNILAFLHSKYIELILQWISLITLELYLTNIWLIEISNHYTSGVFRESDSFQMKTIVIYFFIVILGLILSKITSKVNKKIVTFMDVLLENEDGSSKSVC